jgi:hypothetical protein
MAAGSTYTPIATTTLGSAQASYTFNSISGSYTDLVLISSIQSDSTGNPNIFIKVGNGSIDSGSNYSWTRLFGTGSAASSSRASTATDGVIIGDATPTSFSADIVQFMNYSNTSVYKTILARGNQTQSSTHADVGLWRNTVAINTIQIYCAGRNMIAGTTFTLYGVLNA